MVENQSGEGENPALRSPGESRGKQHTLGSSLRTPWMEGVLDAVDQPEFGDQLRPALIEEFRFQLLDRALREALLSLLPTLADITGVAPDAILGRVTTLDKLYGHGYVLKLPGFDIVAVLGRDPRIRVPTPVPDATPESPSSV